MSAVLLLRDSAQRTMLQVWWRIVNNSTLCERVHDNDIYSTMMRPTHRGRGDIARTVLPVVVSQRASQYRLLYQSLGEITEGSDGGSSSIFFP